MRVAMKIGRTLVPCCQDDSPAVIGLFRCSRCEWEYPLQARVPFGFDYDDTRQAGWEFHRHRCRDHRPRIFQLRPRTDA